MEVAAENPGTWAVGFEDECWEVERGSESRISRK
jgi:hypothetical protein